MQFEVKFEGMASHAGAAPWDGKNALDAAVAAYVNVSLLRQQMKPSWRVTGEYACAGGQEITAPSQESQVVLTSYILYGLDY